MKYSQLYLLVVITLGVIGYVIAEGPPVTHQFVGGDPASATQVNENFQELADRIADIPGSQVFDYRDYSSGATSKTFDYVGSLCSGTADSEIRTFNRVDNGDGTTSVSVTLDRQSSSTTCNHKTFTYLATPTEYIMQSKANNNISGVTQDTDTFNEGLVMRNSTMYLGAAFGSHSTITNDVSGDLGGRIQKVTVLSVEDVTVPLGTYQNCLKIHFLLTSGNNPTSLNRFSWYCPSMGEVKRVHHDLTGSGYARWELSAMS